ncbi:DedA family protein [bacterium]|jgi:membrane protein YqaA with SNARE-associated domain|nr:DedA family protein [bacterium]MBT3729808.1 DedA family protein [bacterium]MBT4894721.1 DedA family protein [bacterium]
MKNYLKKIKISIRDWMLKHAGSKHAKGWLSFFSFAEASFFPIPPDFILIAILGSKQQKNWFYYSALTAGWSVLGGVFGYGIGFLLFDSVGQWLIVTYNLGDHMIAVKELFDQNAFWAIFISGFTPIPYKIFTISAGFFSINFITFIIASAISRFLRFFIVGYIMKMFGEEMSEFAFKYFNILTFIFAVGVIVFITAIKIF